MTADEQSPAVGPADDRPPEPTGYTLADHDAAVAKLHAGETTADALRERFASYRAHEEEVKGELKKKTVAELQKLASSWHASGMKKGELVAHVYEQMGEELIPLPARSGSYDPFRTKRADFQLSRMAAATDEHVKGHAEQVAAHRAEMKAKLSAHVESLQNPQTLEDYQRLARSRGGLEHLSHDELARHDDLAAEKRRGRAMAERQERAKIDGFSGGVEAAGGIGVVVGHHQKRNVPTHTVTVENRLGDEKFREAVTAAKRLGGSYVNANVARAYNATPGFQFFDEGKAKQFADYLRGASVDRSADVAGEMAARQQARAGSLADRAAALESAGQERYAQDRRENTGRQAAMAASARAEAQKQIAHGRTLAAVARGQEDGTLKHLNGVRSPEDLHTLERAARLARYDRVRAAEKAKPGGLTYREREAMEQEPHGHPDDLRHVRFPHPTAHQSELRDVAKALKDEPGLKRFAEKMAKLGDVNAAVKFQGSVGGMKAAGGRLVTPEQFKDHKDAAFILGAMKQADGEHGQVRVHASHDWRLAQAAEKQGQSSRGPFHTADKGKTWATTPDGAVIATLNKGNPLDLVPRPEDKVLTLSDPDDVDAVRTAARKLAGHADDRLRRIGQNLKEKLEHHDRLKRADVHTAAELRAALREYHGLRVTADREDPVKAAERGLKGRDIDGFFPTPRPVIDDMLDRADIQPGHAVLEPSAGKGDILDAVRERHPDASTHAIEPVSDLRHILGLKGHTLVGHDVKEHQGQYDRAVMNPPFERGQDAEHVRHVFDHHLKPGGRLVAVMSEGPFHRQDKQAQEFRAWLESVGGTHEPIEDGAFNTADAFRKTGVRTRLVTVDKPTAG